MDLTQGVTGLGVAADLVGLAAGIYGGFRFFPRFVSWIRRRQFTSVEAFVDSKTTSLESASSKLKRLRLAIVDDEPSSFPIDHLKAISGQVSVFEQIELSAISKLHDFDIVFLDISGVVPEDTKNGGIEVLRRLRSDGRAEPLLIAVSSKTFKPEINKFFSLADDVLSKPLRAADTENALLDLVAEKLTTKGVAKVADTLIVQSPNVSSRSIRKAVSSVTAYVDSSGKDAAWLRKQLFKLSIKSSDELVSLASLLKRLISAT